MVRSVLLGACVALASACAHSNPSTAQPPVSTIVESNAVLVRVVDGDTVVVDIGGDRETLRLIGIDTPETVKPNSPVECFGPQASAFTKRFLPVGTPLRLERDVEARDDYGRLLVYVYLAADGTFVNLELVRQGYATLLTFPPNVAHVDDFVAAAQTAQQADLGLWSACSG
jgi:micrococcal nuclease